MLGMIWFLWRRLLHAAGAAIFVEKSSRWERLSHDVCESFFQQFQTLLACFARHDDVDLNFAGVDHFHIDASLGERLEHPQPNSGVTSHADAGDRKFCDAGAVGHTGSTEFFDKSFRRKNRSFQVFLGDGEAQIRQAILPCTLDNHVNKDARGSDLLEDLRRNAGLIGNGGDGYSGLRIIHGNGINRQLFHVFQSFNNHRSIGGVSP